MTEPVPDCLPPWNDAESETLRLLLAHGLAAEDAFIATLSVRPGTFTIYGCEPLEDPDRPLRVTHYCGPLL